MPVLEVQAVCPPPGRKGAILRRERLYHSHIIEWRAARDTGAGAPQVMYSVDAQAVPRPVNHRSYG